MEILGAFIISLVIALLFVPFRKDGPAAPLIVFFLILFMAALAANYWVVPFGPIMWGVSWLRILFVVLIFALLFSVVPPVRASSRKDAQDAAGAAAISVFVWMLWLLLLVAIIAGFYLA
jgi:hypothetical protein